MATPFTQDKRNYLHSRLDEVIRLWFRNTGQGYFNLVVNDGEPEFQYGVHLDLCDGLQPEHPQPTQPQQLRSGQHGVRRRGPARQARDRQRAAAHQAAKAAASAATHVPAVIFPGVGQTLGMAAKPTLPLPLSKGAVFPPYPAPAVSSTLPVVSSMASVSSSLTTNITTTTSSLSQPLTTPVAVPVTCRDEVVNESDDEVDEQFTFCGQCLKSFDSSSTFGGCPRCMKAYHQSCAKGHTCLSYL
jgi:hypothetical protein